MVSSLRRGWMLLPVLLIVLAAAVLMSQGEENPRNLPIPRPPDTVSGEVIGGVLGKEGDVTVTHEPDGRVVVEHQNSDLMLTVSAQSGWCEMMLFDRTMPHSLSSNGWYVIAADQIDNPHQEGDPCFPEEGTDWERLIDVLYQLRSGNHEAAKQVVRELIAAYMKYGRIGL